MKQHLRTLIIILVCLGVLIPFASNAPDGLEKVAETFGIEEHEPIWTGLMPDYTFPVIDNDYISTLLAGVIGVFLVLGAAFALGVILTKQISNK